MARIAFGWEMGASYGHAVPCAGLGRSLALRGHAIALMFRELRQLAVLPEAADFDVFQAPRSVRESRNLGIPASIADILLGCGYRDASELTGLLGGWRALFARWRPDLVVADYAPTALLAAHSLGIPRVTYGNGFFTPPRLTPLPPFRVDAPVDPAHIAASDAAALFSANAALRHYAAPPLERLADLFAVEEDFLCTFPELDHYGTRETSGYWGPRIRLDLGSVVPWPAGPGRCVLVYVQKSLPQLDALIDCLAASPHRVLAYIPDLDEGRRARLAARNRIVLQRPIRMDAALKECNLMVSLGGEVAGGVLACGVPSLIFPGHYEQYLTARRLEQLGAGGWLAPAAGAADVAAALGTMTTDGRFQAAARAFAKRYAAYSPAEQRRRIVQRIEAILSRSPTPPGSER